MDSHGGVQVDYHGDQNGLEMNQFLCCGYLGSQICFWIHSLSPLMSISCICSCVTSGLLCLYGSTHVSVPVMGMVSVPVFGPAIHTEVVFISTLVAFFAICRALSRAGETVHICCMFYLNGCSWFCSHYQCHSLSCV